MFLLYQKCQRKTSCESPHPLTGTINRRTPAPSLVGDTRAAVETYSKQADCVIANMVLHHTPNPAEICHELSQCLKAGGSLIICDLLSHDQSWARENCGDVWLGFDENELKSWASLAGLNSGQETFLTLRNGFRIQVQQFLKN